MYIRSSETYNLAEKVLTFAGGTVNDPGDFDGTGNPAVLFTVTGTVFCKLFAVVEVAPVGATATISVGTTITPVGAIASTTATNLAIGEIWHDATPDASVELATVAAEKIVSQNIIQTIGTANITAGRLRYVCLWRPITANATVA